MDWQTILRTLAPKALPVVREAFLSADSNFADFQINTPLRQAHFMAQALHETGGFTRIDENLNYSAEGLRKTFPRYFPDDEIAKKFHRKPEAIANRVYGQRMGNSKAGDGWRYHGRGLFQLTGFKNYEAMGKRSQLPLLIQPDLVTFSRYLLPIACHFWTAGNYNAQADQDDCRGITYRLNGGLNGLEDRIAWLAKVKAVLGA